MRGAQKKKMRVWKSEKLGEGARLHSIITYMMRLMNIFYFLGNAGNSKKAD